MHDGDELLDLHITGDAFDCGSDGVVSGEQRVHDEAKMFYLEIDLAQYLKGTTIVKVVVKRHDKMRVSDDSDGGGVFSGRRE